LIGKENYRMTQLTIELPDQLAAQLSAYLENYPTETLAELIRDALQIRLMPKDSSKLLALAGIVTEAPRGAAEHAEDLED
jgi:metal-responsive CopG/Arc/MetJ family transcriptional regulator